MQFQSHIGPIKTIDVDEVNVNGIRFQSHIGPIKTGKRNITRERPGE